MSYRNVDCNNCGRHRVLLNGVCEKCNWDNDRLHYVNLNETEESKVPEFISDYDRAANQEDFKDD